MPDTVSVSPTATMLPAVVEMLDTAVKSYCATLPAVKIVMLVALETGVLSNSMLAAVKFMA
jgi:hypothetical protein